MEINVPLVNTTSVNPCIFELFMNSSCTNFGWPADVSAYLVSLLLPIQNVSVNFQLAKGYSQNGPLQGDWSIMGQLARGMADLSPPFMTLTPSRASNIGHIGVLKRVRPVLIFRQILAVQFDLRLTDIFSPKYLVLFFAPFLFCLLLIKLAIFDLNSE